MESLSVRWFLNRKICRRIGTYTTFTLFAEGDNATVLDILARTSWDKKNLNELGKKYDDDMDNEKVKYRVE